jgi:uncharacterized membrane protein YccF (DUF307 family)
MRWVCVAALLCACLVGGDSKKVLIIGIPMISHMNEINTIGMELANMGHTVYQVNLQRRWRAGDGTS